MQHLVVSLGLVAAVLAAPAPPKLRPEPRQVGGQLSGYVPGASGLLTGYVPATGLPFGCIGGVVDGQGVTVCARDALPTPAPEVEARQVGGGLGGYVPGASGTLSGDVPASGVPYGCIGGVVDGDGVTVCARDALPTPAPQVKARQVGGALSGYVPGASGFLTGYVPATGLPFGCIGGVVDGFGATVCARWAAPTPPPGKRQVGGGLGGYVPGASGTLTGIVPATGLPFGCIGGVVNGQGETICARAPAPTPAPVLGRQVGGGLGGYVPGASGFVGGTIVDGNPFGCIGGILEGEGATACAKKARRHAPTPVAEAN